MEGHGAQLAPLSCHVLEVVAFETGRPHCAARLSTGLASVAATIQAVVPPADHHDACSTPKIPRFVNSGRVEEASEEAANVLEDLAIKAEECFRARVFRR